MAGSDGSSSFSFSRTFYVVFHNDSSNLLPTPIQRWVMVLFFCAYLPTLVIFGLFDK